MATLVEDLVQSLRSQLSINCPEQSAETRESIIRWLLGNDLKRFETQNPANLEIAKRAMEYRWHILQRRYLEVPPEQAYRNLMNRLGSLVLLRNKIRTFVAKSRDRTSTVVDVLQEVIQELLTNDRYMQQQIAWIASCTDDAILRNALLLTSTEEYCLRPIRNQPLLVYRFVNYLRRSQRGGLTQVPTSTLLRLVSEEMQTNNSEKTFSPLDTQAVAHYLETQAFEEQQALRTQVKQEFSRYLAQQLGPVAVRWFQLYLQGWSQNAIASYLNLQIKDVYRLREKVSYHATHIVASKRHPELVNNWLNT